MHRTAIAFALRYSFRLGRDHNGYYNLRDFTGAEVRTSYYPTAKSAIVMMRRALRSKTEGLELRAMRGWK